MKTYERFEEWSAQLGRRESAFVGIAPFACIMFFVEGFYLVGFLLLIALVPYAISCHRYMTREVFEPFPLNEDLKDSETERDTHEATTCEATTCEADAYELIYSVWQNEEVFTLSWVAFFLMAIMFGFFSFWSKGILGELFYIIVVVTVFIGLLFQIKAANLKRTVYNFIVANPKRIVIKAESCQIEKKKVGTYIRQYKVSVNPLIRDKEFCFEETFTIDIQNVKIKEFESYLKREKEFIFVYNEENPSYHMMEKSKHMGRYISESSGMKWREDRHALTWFALDVLLAVVSILVAVNR